jgi:Ca2+/Na+ antiporter
MVTREHFIWGLADGVTVLSIAAAFWVGLAAWTAGPTVLLISAAPILLLCALLIWRGSLLRRQAVGISRASFRHAPRGSQIRKVGALYSAVGTAQFLGIVFVAFICWTTSRPDLTWTLIALVVSLHFVPLGWIFNVRPYYVLGVLGIAIALISLLAFNGSGRTVAVGLGLGLVVGGCAAYMVANAGVLADAAPRKRSPTAEAQR